MKAFFNLFPGKAIITAASFGWDEKAAGGHAGSGSGSGPDSDEEVEEEAQASTSVVGKAKAKAGEGSGKAKAKIQIAIPLKAALTAAEAGQAEADEEEDQAKQLAKVIRSSFFGPLVERIGCFCWFLLNAPWVAGFIAVLELERAL